MAEIVKMPKLSDTMTEGVVAKWHKKVGDKVKSGDLLADIETDKATMEFESYQDGVLLHIGIPEKGTAPVDSLLAILGKEGEDITALLKETNKVSNGVAQKEEKTNVVTASPKVSALPATVQIVRMPKLSDTMTEGVIAKWHKKEGDKVKSGELLADIETDKATMEFESFQDGVLLHKGIEEGKSIAVDAVIAILGKGDENVKEIIAAVAAMGNTKTQETVASENTKTTAIPENKKPIQNPVKNSATSILNGGRVKASPLAKALAKEKGIDIREVKGSAENGRITKADIENYKGGSGSGKQYSLASAQESFTDEPASQMRKTIARRLLESKNGAPHFYLNIEVDMDNAISAREAINKVGEVKISFNDLVVKAVASALKKHPRVNSSWMGDKIRINHHIHVGIAIAVEDGLLVPVVRFTDYKSLDQISLEIKDFGKRAKEKKLQPNDWEGNTFTVSNLGMFGIESFTSIINSPESCILSVGTIKQVPVVKNNQVVPGNVMMLTLACDHRSVDGATGAAFLQTLKMYLENPVTIFI
ncbi:MAG: pyruvate dehydrogenase complex dihydrolipoamide acetyltransferase [Sphingobacteriaceae bacterium]|nr:pyruvate dehydrogenase complex dihydrolipoamide acetyltransferase [Sphingobacteriaceae bacterium]